jgi:hypothetical protein
VFAACAEDAACLKAVQCLFEKNCLVWNGDPQPPDDAGDLITVNRNPACLDECVDGEKVYLPNAGSDGGLAANPALTLYVCEYGLTKRAN